MIFLLDPPTFVDAPIFTTLPANFRRTGSDASWVRANRRGVDTHSFLEGPVFDGAGNLFVTDIPYGRIFRIDPAGHWEVVTEYGGEPNGMKMLNDKELLVTDYRLGLVVVDIASGQVRDYLSRRHSEGFKGLNDLTFDSRGSLYFTDQGQTGLHDPSGRVFRLAKDGRLDMLLSNVPSPNGLALSRDEKVLFVAATRGNCVWRVPLAEDGGVTKVGQFFTSYGPAGPDGLAMDRHGRLVVCNPGLGCAWVLNGRGEPVQVVRSSHGSSVTNVALSNDLAGGEQMAYFTESSSGSILRVSLAAG